MHEEVHLNMVLYRNTSSPGHKYRQIVIVERDQFLLLILGGDVIQTAPFNATSSDAEVYFHSTLQSAEKDAKEEYEKSKKAGWIPFP